MNALELTNWRSTKNKVLAECTGDDFFRLAGRFCYLVGVLFISWVLTRLVFHYFTGGITDKHAFAGVIGVLMAMVILLNGLVANGIYGRRLTDHRLRGLADYVEGLRLYTVMRTNRLTTKVDSLIDSDSIETLSAPPVKVPTEPTEERPLNKKERDTLLTIIAALAKEAKIDIRTPGKSALYIEGLTAGLGANVSKRAIEEHLKKIPDALETLMK